MSRATGVEGIISRVNIDDAGCWRWLGTMSVDGYPRIANKRAHRISYQLFVGDIPDGYTIDHLCRVRDCVNPAHLEAVTMRENTLRGDTLAARQAAQTHCKRGHEFNFENTILTHDGRRQCKKCYPIRRRERKQRLAA